jgi:hypothetical protein
MYTCPQCNKTYENLRQLIGHRKIHSEKYILNKENIFKNNSELYKKRALDKYNLNPRYCKFCNKRFDYNVVKADCKKRYCNRSCSASHNNRGRIRSETSKNKISQKLKERFNVIIIDTSCKSCNKTIKVKKIHKHIGNYCTDCIKMRNNATIKKYNCIVCNKNILKNKFKMCKSCWIISEEFAKQRGNYRKNFIKGYYFCKYEKKDVYLNSSLEFAFAKFCDDENIKWSKPTHLNYTINNKQHIYFPDFYLNEHDIYIEVKGYFWMNDREKMNAVIACNSDKRIKIIEQKELNQLISKEREFIAQ